MACVTVCSFQVFEDGSGAPAVLEMHGVKVACDFLKEHKFHLLDSGSSFQSMQIIKRCVPKIQNEYRKMVSLLPQEWFDKNAAMYSDA